MKAKYWAIGWITLVGAMLTGLLVWVYDADPYVHFHKPNTTRYYYTLDYERGQNNGIIKHYEYDAIITGSSMTENFKTSEMDDLFGCHSIKVPFAGATYKEINDNLAIAVEHNPDLSIVVRGLDAGYLLSEKDLMVEWNFPEYLYDSDWMNDMEYILNRDVICGRVYPMTIARWKKSVGPGITSFDDYMNWQEEREFGADYLIPDGITDVSEGESKHLTEAEKELIAGNICQNVTNLAKANPDITFYYFITPYSVLWWHRLMGEGNLYREVEIEEYAFELMFECDNIRLYAFGNKLDITCNLDNYCDWGHYGEEINSLILQWMHDGEGLITKENYKQYLQEEFENYYYFDYESLNEQLSR